MASKEYFESVRAYALNVIRESEELLEKLGGANGKYADVVARTQKKHKALLAKIERRIARATGKANDA